MPAGLHLDGMFQLLLEVMGNIIAVCNISDARQGHT